MTKDQNLMKRQEILPQKNYDLSTFFDLFLEILQQRGAAIELPDFWTPQIDVYESGTFVTLEIEVPGMDLQDFAITVDGDLINIKGEKHRVENLTEGAYTRMERRYGLFDRTLRLSSEVIGNKASTTYEHGVLKITLPKIKDPEQQNM
jgi:HSP20 family molecular chaperone IbpA